MKTILENSKLIGFSIVVILLLSFYWFFYRPSKIRENCHQKAVNEVFAIGNKGLESTFETQTYKDAYSACLHESGLQ